MGDAGNQYERYIRKNERKNEEEDGKKDYTAGRKTTWEKSTEERSWERRGLTERLISRRSRRWARAQTSERVC